MTPKQFYDWQTAGGTDDVMRLSIVWNEQILHGAQWRRSC